VNYLKEAGIDIALLDAAAGQIVNGTVTSLLGKPAFMELLDEMLVRIADGMPMSDLTTVVIQAVLDRPDLQIALGMSLGDGFGSLFGDNIIGAVIGTAAGFTATIAIGMAVGLVRLYLLFFPQQSVANLIPGSASSDYAAYAFPAAAGRHSQQPDLYDLNALVPTGSHGAAVLHAAAGGSLTVTEFAITPAEAARPDVLDIAMGISTAADPGTDSEHPPVLVRFRFHLGRLIQMSAPAPVAVTPARVSQTTA
jgi:hypothetical protein